MLALQTGVEAPSGLPEAMREQIPHLGTKQSA